MEFIGGQAVIEGVLIKSGKKVAIATRDASGKISIKKEEYKSITHKYKLLNLPIIRGPIILFETTVLGLKALNYSANKSLEKEEEKLSTISIVTTITLSIIFALALFKLLPLGIAQLASNNFTLFQNRFLFNILEGLTKIMFLVGYITLIGMMPDVKRVFQYHGAEHKIVNAYEKRDLVNARKYSRIHIRCGTSFVLFVLALSIIVYMIIPLNVSFLAKYAIRIALLPLIAGIGYEIIRLSPKYEKYFWFKALISPGLLLQRLTTREPDDKQLEVACAAVQAVA